MALTGRYLNYRHLLLFSTINNTPKSAIKSIRVRLYEKPLLPEEVMGDPRWKIAQFASETAGLLN